MKRLNLVAVSILTLFSAAEANAGPVIFTAHLTGPNENPANNSAGIGDATVTFDLDSHTMAVSATFSGLTGVTMASHIHCCVAAPGGNAGVATQTPSFVGFPLGVTSGSFSTLLDMSLASSFNPAFVTANGNIANAEQVLFNGALNGTAYFNIHSSVFGGGEIRGFLVAVSEPATISALGFGLASLFLVRRRLRV